jgi:signal transduction histidine kinase
VALLCRDVTELRRLEAERQQTESLEILGRLALDVAHDFGKFLAIIKAEVELLQEYPPDTPLEDAELQVIADAADSGVALTRELIAFARGESVQFVDSALELACGKHRGDVAANAERPGETASGSE